MDWSAFNRFSDEFDAYLPDMGEGDTKASQVATAVSKLVYKWFNDGDVYDNNYYMEGWANDLSSYANWLYKYIPKTQSILDGIESCRGDDSYEQLLYNLCELCADPQELAAIDQEPKVGSVYDCSGPYSFTEYSEDDDEDWDDEDYEEDDEYYD
ncbi:MAG: hypothetical protein IJE78_05630 [Bacteroidaceae bacterium]|nr:hypothetical protein [Bacteroidaceae bacterium]